MVWNQFNEIAIYMDSFSINKSTLCVLILESVGIIAGTDEILETWQSCFWNPSAPYHSQMDSGYVKIRIKPEQSTLVLSICLRESVWRGGIPPSQSLGPSTTQVCLLQA